MNTIDATVSVGTHAKDHHTGDRCHLPFKYLCDRSRSTKSRCAPFSAHTWTTETISCHQSSHLTRGGPGARVGCVDEVSRCLTFARSVPVRLAQAHAERRALRRAFQSRQSPL